MTGSQQSSSRTGIAVRVVLTAAIACALMLATATSAFAYTDRTDRISKGYGEGLPSERPSVSSDGRYVAFQSMADGLVAGVSSPVGQIYVFDRTSRTMECVSVSDAGTIGDGDSSYSAISADGRWVAFVSTSDNLTTDDTDIAPDYYLYDRQTRTITCITGGTGGAGGNYWRPAISANGRFVAFQTDSENLPGVPAFTGDPNTDIFVYDRLDLPNPTIQRVSVTSIGGAGDGNSQHPSISADGGLIAFESYASNFVADDTNEMWDVFLRSRVAHTTTRVSVTGGGSQASGNSQNAAISADGAYVAYSSDAPDLVPSDANGVTDVFRCKIADGSVVDVTQNATAASDAPSLDGDGSFVAFQSDAVLVPEDVNGLTDIYSYDFAGETFVRESLHSYSSVEPNGGSYLPMLDGGADYCAFQSDASNISANDTNTASDVFIRYRHPDVTPATTIVNVTPSSPLGNGGYYITTPTVDLIPDEPASLFYQWDAQAPGSWSTYATAITPPLGSHTLYYFSVDTANNTETVQGFPIKVDTELPRAADNAVDFSYNSTTITITASDTVTGIEGIYWRIDGSANFTESNVASCSVPGVHTIEYYAKDLAGNYGTPKIVPFTVTNRHEESDPNITFGTNKWSTYYSASYSGGYLNRGRGSGLGFVINFTGPAVDWVGQKSNQMGKARVSLDGEPTQTIDLYNSSTVNKQVLYTRHDLTNSSHSLRVLWTGLRNQNAFNDYINADAFDIAGITTTGSPWLIASLHYEEDDPLISYGTTYTTVVASASSGGTLRTMNAEGSGYTMTFVGSGIELTGRRGPNQGIATITIDGTPVDTLDLYSSTTLDAQGVWTKQDFVEDTHTVRIDWTGSKNASSTGTAINLDAVDINGELAQAPDHVSRYEQTDPRVYYKGTWATGANAGRSGGTWAYTSASGGAALLTFVGSKANLVVSKAPSYGIAKITLDGGTPEYADLYDPNYFHQMRVWSASGLGSGTHTLLVEYSGTKNTASTGYTIGIDALDLVGTPVADTVAPVTADDAPTAWRSAGATVTLTSTDVGGFVTATRYRVNGGAPTTYTAPFSVSAEGTDTIEYFSADTAGNVEATKTAVVRVDKTAPTLSDDAPVAWVKSPVNVHLSGVDTASGVNSILYSTDGSAPTLSYTTSITVSADGTTTIKYQAIDNVGNVSTVKSIDVRVDKVLPFSSSDAPSGWATSAVNVTIGATDTLSGVLGRLYRVDGSANATYVAPVVISADGTHTLDFHAVDVAGNVEPTNTVMVRVDKTAPTIGDDAPAGWVNGPVTVHLTSADTVSGIQSVLYSSDGSEPSLTYGAGIVIGVEGTTTIRYKATDRAGLVTSGQATVRVDNGAPTVSHDAPAGWVNGPVTVHLTTADAVSGVASVLYSTDGSAPTQTYGPGITVSAEGTTTLRYRVTDLTGNSVAGTTTVRIDDTVPTASDDAPSSWVNGPVHVHLTTGDAVSGVSTVTYSLDGSAPTSAYASSVTVSSEGTTTLRYRVLDRTGNSTSATTTVRIDDFAPQVTDDAPSGWVTGTVTVHLSIQATSGVSSVVYSTDGSVPTVPYVSGIGVSADGTTTVRYRVTNAAGNSSNATTTVRIDNAAPVTTSNAVATYVTSATVTLSATDPHSGVGLTEYRLDGGAWTAGNVIGTSVAGAHTLQYRSTDHVGNVESTHPVSFDVLARNEQTDSRIYYRGGWGTGVNASRSGGSWAYASSANQAAFLNFTGTRVDLVASKAPSYGLAKITLDGGSPQYVDLYDGGFLHQVRVWSETGLANSQHNLVIEWTGSKNASSTGNTIGIDTIDVAGALDADTIKPVSMDDASSAWRTTPETVTLTPSDQMSFVAATHYSVNGAAAVTYTAPFSVSGEGTDTIEYGSVDGAGNAETSKTATVRIDRVAPAVTDDAPAAWVNTTTTVRLSTVETGSGLASTLYSTDGSDPSLSYGAGIVVSAEGTTAVRYKAVDVLGNTSLVRSSNVRIDRTPPSTSNDATSAWLHGPVSLNLSALDAMSGVQATFFSVDGSGISTATGPIVLSTEGTHTVTYHSTDKAGNTESDQEATVKVDSTSPTASDDAPTGWVGGPVIVHVNASDALSGIASILYSIDGSVPSVPYSAGITISSEGTTTARYTVVDHAGNSTSATTTVRVDNTGPSVSADAPGAWVNGPVTVHVTAADAVSGVGSLVYSTDGSAPSVPYGSGIIVSSEGTTTLRYRATDLKGNSTDGTATVRLDNSVPTITDDAPAGWSNANVVVHLTAGDAVSGLNVVLYSTDGSTPSVSYGSGITVSSEGTTAVRYKALDRVGNSTSGTATVRLDKTAPAASDDAPAGWVTSPPTVHLSASDAVSGLGSLLYSTDGTTPSHVYSSALLISAEGTTTIRYRATDNAANSTAVTTTVRLDSFPPTTTSNAAPQYVATATVALTAVDAASGVAQTQYSLDGGAWTSGTNVTTTTVGHHALQFRSTDRAGNVETARSASFDVLTRFEEIDSRILFRGTWPSGANGSRSAGAWTYASAAATAYVTFSGARIDLIVSKAPSYGIARVRVDGGAPQSVDLYDPGYLHQARVWSSGALADGTHTLTIEWTGSKNASSTGSVIGVDALDVAGTILADTVAPVTTDDSSGAWRSTLVTVTLTATDANSWVGSTRYAINGSAATTYVAPITASAEGTTVIEYRSVDGAGNIESSKTATVRIDKTSPSVADDAPTVWVHGPVTVHVDATDSGSGVSSILYSTDGSDPSTPYAAGIVVSSEGTTAVRYKAVDAVGRVSAVGAAQVRIDDHAPASSDDSTMTWLSSPASIHLTAADPLSGVAGIVYGIDGSDVTTYGTSVVVAAEGTHTLTYNAVDHVGNAEAANTAIVRIDTSAPTISDDSPAGWVASPVTVRLTSGDIVSGIESVLYSNDGSEPTLPYTGSILVSTDGTTTLRYKAIDRAGNATSGSAVVRIDAGAPTISDDVPAGWATAPVAVHLTSGDIVSGIESVLYSTDGSEPALPYTGSILVSTDGTTTLRYKAIDRAGNATIGSAVVRLDTDAPAISDDAPAGWVTAPVTVHLTSGDTISGTESVLYSDDGSEPTLPYTGSILVSTDGTTAVRYKAIDRAGNATSGSAVVRIDTGAPATTDNVPAGWANASFALHLSAIDSVSGIASTGYRFDTAALAPAIEPLTLPSDGTHTLAYHSTDVAGNTESTKTATLRLDTAPPTTSSNATSTYTGTATVTLTASETLSGLAGTSYSLDGSAWTSGTVVATSAAGPHTLQFRSSDVAGNTESAKSVTFGILRRYEETDSRIAYRGTWASGANAARSGGAWIYSSTSGGTSYMTFTGTRVDLIASKAPSYGKARITLDGGAPQYADLYDPAFLHQKQIWSATGLASGTHTLLIEWSGSKNASSTGNVIGIDALDIVGSPIADTMAPLTADDAPSAWRSTPATVTLSSVDLMTWVASTRYALNGAAATTYAAPFAISAEGTTSIEYRSVDGVGNVEASRTAMVRIDRTAPTVTDDAPTGWAAAVVGVHLTVTDAASGVGTISYSTDGSEPTLPYSGSIVASADGTTTIRYKASDAVGNTSGVKTATVRVDTVAPTSSDDAPTGWTGPVAVHVTSTDGGSGVAARFYAVDGSDVTTYVAPVSFSTDGTHTLTYFAVDNAGNAESARSRQVRVDATPPTTSSNATSTYTSTATISLTATDNITGVVGTEYSLDGSSWTSGTALTTAAPGPHTLVFRSVDGVGNREASKTAQFGIVARYEDNDSLITYEGPWSAIAKPARSGGSWTSASATGTAFINFTGNRIDFIVSKAPTYGIARVTIDGSTTVDMDLYSSAYLDQQRGLSLWGLTNGPHVLRVEWTGSKNASSTGTSIGIDALEVVGRLTQAPPPLRRYEDTDTHIAYGGAWTAGSRSTRSSGSWKYTNELGAGAYVAFTGTRIDIIASKAPAYGIARITVDSNAPVYADLYSPSYPDQQSVASITGLSNTAHTVKIEFTGTKNAASGGYTVGLDAVDIVGVLSQATAPAPTVTRFEQNDPKIVLEGGWATAANASRSGGNWAYANAATDTAWISFTGTRIDLIASKAPSYGIAKVTIDGTGTGTADLYDAAFKHQQVAYSLTGLANTAHTVKVEWTGSKNASSTGSIIGLDAIDITGSLNQALALHEQDDPRIVLHGAWSTAANAARSGGSWAYTQAADAAAFVVFKGTRVDLLVSKAPSYGIAKVTLDGSSTANVDLYDAAFKHQQTAYTVSGLTDTTHTVKFEWTGSKNASSTGTIVGIDRVDTLGPLLQATDLSSPLVRYEETSPQLSFTGTWTVGSNATRSGGSWKFTDASATVSFSFTGTRVDLLASKAPSYGIARVAVDGGAPQTADLYDPAFLHQARVFSLSGLPDGPHSVQIQWTGTKNAASSGTVVGLDAIEIVGTLGP